MSCASAQFALFWRANWGDYMRWNASIVSVLAVIAASSASAQELPRGVREFAWAPPAEMTAEEGIAAAGRCMTVAFQAREGTQIGSQAAVQGFVQGGLIGAGVAHGIAQSEAQAEAYEGALAHCHHDSGFIQVGLTRGEYRQWRAAGITARRHAFLAEVLSANPERAISPARLPPRPPSMSSPQGTYAEKPAAEPAGATEGESEAVTTEVSAEAVAADATSAEPAAVDPASSAASPEETAPSQ
jgi:hypothetical protein